MSNITLPDLPYAKDALEPHISAETLEYHHDKHHAAYVNKLNELLPGSGLEDKTLPEIIKATAKDDSKQGMFNQAAQVWNHTFYWNCMTPTNGGGEPGEPPAPQRGLRDGILEDETTMHVPNVSAKPVGTQAISAGAAG